MQEGGARPADVFAPAGSSELYGGNDAIMDVTIGNAAGGDALEKGSARVSLKAAMLREDAKRSSFRRLVSQCGGLWRAATFVPLAFEATGAFGPSMAELFLKVCAIWHEVNNGSSSAPGLLGADFAWSSMSFKELWLQKFSFALASSTASAVEVAAKAVRRGALHVTPV